jgi:exopolysaccharide biosynthesis WecB/TagA/CpsF family protein
MEVFSKVASARTQGNHRMCSSPDGSVNKTPQPPVRFLGLNFRSDSISELAEELIESASANIRQQIYFVNAHCVNVAARDPDYKSLLQCSDALCADGVGMALAACLWGQRVQSNLNGTDLFPVLCERAARSNTPVAFIGARPGVAMQCAQKMVRLFPDLRVVSVAHGFMTADEENQHIQRLNNSGAKILFVAKGVPLQEIWMRDHAAGLEVPVVLGVGALFDFYSGVVRRAPPLIRKLRLEWLFRLLMEPRRLFRRYVIGNPEFLFRALYSRLSGI